MRLGEGSKLEAKERANKHKYERGGRKKRENVSAKEARKGRNGGKGKVRR